MQPNLTQAVREALHGNGIPRRGGAAPAGDRGDPDAAETTMLSAIRAPASGMRSRPDTRRTGPDRTSGTDPEPADDGDQGGRGGPGRRRAPKPPAAPKPRSALIVSGIAEGLLTLGVVLVLFLVYELWWTNVQARSSEHKAEERVRSQLGKVQTTFTDGQPFAYLFVPAFGKNFKAAILQGTSDAVINTGGVGHYDDPQTAMPWQEGNFALAGHDDVHGEVFRPMDTGALHAGDHVIVETGLGWYVYQLDSSKTVSPSDVSVLDPIPVGSTYTKPGYYITLTTCTPLFRDYNRLAWFGHLVRHLPYGAPPPSEMNGP